MGHERLIDPFERLWCSATRHVIRWTATAPRRWAIIVLMMTGPVLASWLLLPKMNYLPPGTVLISEGTEFVFVGESAKHAGKALMYSADTDGFKSFGADKLADFEIVADESEEEEEEDERDGSTGKAEPEITGVSVPENQDPEL
jgi:hypothetical protein